MTIENYIKLMLKERDITQAELARQVGTSPQSLSESITRKQGMCMKIENLLKMAEILGFTITFQTENKTFTLDGVDEPFENMSNTAFNALYSEAEGLFTKERK